MPSTGGRVEIYLLFLNSVRIVKWGAIDGGIIIFIFVRLVVHCVSHNVKNLIKQQHASF